jgi:hypothetical protein
LTIYTAFASEVAEHPVERVERELLDGRAEVPGRGA